jgi:hypothetical protein
MLFQDVIFQDVIFQDMAGMLSHKSAFAYIAFCPMFLHEFQLKLLGLLLSRRGR